MKDLLKEQRKLKRSQLPQIMYDCAFARILGDKVKCFGNGNDPKKTTMPVTRVMEGDSPKICRLCPKFECTGEGEE